MKGSVEGFWDLIGEGGMFQSPQCVQRSRVKSRSNSRGLKACVEDSVGANREEYDEDERVKGSVEGKAKHS